MIIKAIQEIEAIQYTGNNLKELLEFGGEYVMPIGNKIYIRFYDNPNKFLLEKGDFLIRNSSGTLLQICSELTFKKNYSIIYD